MLAMHMADSLLNLPTAGVTCALAAGIVALASWRTRRTVHAARLPLMGVVGAFVFAAQMINFTLPLMPGTSGHLGGAVLLAILMGPWAAVVAMAGILIVQCLMFQDGGMLALGCNIINMGVVPAFTGWWLYRALAGRASAGAWRKYLAAWTACTVGVTAGAALVPFQTAVSGMLQVPLGTFLATMVAVHLLIGLGEGAITFAVLAWLRQVRPALLGEATTAGDEAGAASSPRAPHAGPVAVAASLVLTAMLLAGVASWFASTHEDGLEWTIAHLGAVDEQTADPAVAKVSAWHAQIAPLPDYTMPSDQPDADEQAAAWPNIDGWGSLAGLAGTLATLGLLYALALVLRRRFAAPSPAQLTEPGCTTAT